MRRPFKRLLYHGGIWEAGQIAVCGGAIRRYFDLFEVSVNHPLYIVAYTEPSPDRIRVTFRERRDFTAVFCDGRRELMLYEAKLWLKQLPRPVHLQFEQEG